MKNLVLLIILTFLTVTFTNAQLIWQHVPANVNLNGFDAHGSIGWAVGDNGVIMRTSNSGVNWTIVNSGTTQNLKSVHFHEMPYSDIGYACGNNGTILKSTNGGINWVQQNSGTTLNLGHIVFLNPPSQNIGSAVGNLGTIFGTTDGGVHWIAEDSGTNNDLHSIENIPNNPPEMFAVGNAGTIVRTTNGGNNWFQQNSFTYYNIHSIVSIPFNFQELFAVADFGTILHTTNSGTNWQPRYIGTMANLKSVDFPTASTGYVCGSEGTILKTIDGGANWKPLPIPPLESMVSLNDVFFPDGNTGWIVGDSGTILYTTNGGVFVNNIGNKIPGKYVLYQNYPNPFNPSTTIRFDIPKSGFTSLIVYDILGREVAVLGNEFLKAGSYETEWFAGDYNSGVYFYKLIAEDYIDVKKMVLMK